MGRSTNVEIATGGATIVQTVPVQHAPRWKKRLGCGVCDMYS